MVEPANRAVAHGILKVQKVKDFSKHFGLQYRSPTQVTGSGTQRKRSSILTGQKPTVNVGFKVDLWQNSGSGPKLLELVKLALVSV